MIYILLSIIHFTKKANEINTFTIASIKKKKKQRQKEEQKKRKKTKNYFFY